MRERAAKATGQSAIPIHLTRSALEPTADVRRRLAEALAAAGYEPDTPTFVTELVTDVHMRSTANGTVIEKSAYQPVGDVIIEDVVHLFDEPMRSLTSWTLLRPHGAACWPKGRTRPPNRPARRRGPFPALSQSPPGRSPGFRCNCGAWADQQHAPGCPATRGAVPDN